MVTLLESPALLSGWSLLGLNCQTPAPPDTQPRCSCLSPSLSLCFSTADWVQNQSELLCSLGTKSWQTLNPHNLLPESLSLCSSFAVTVIVFESPWSGIFQVGLDMHLLSCQSTRMMLNFTFLILSDTKIIKFCTNPNFNYLQNLMIYEFASITTGLKYTHLKMQTSLMLCIKCMLVGSNLIAAIKYILANTHKYVFSFGYSMFPVWVMHERDTKSSLFLSS